MRRQLGLALSACVWVACGEREGLIGSPDATSRPDVVIDAGPVEGCGPAVEGEPCDDGLVCTTGDVCTDGICTGVPVECAASNACVASACNPETGACEETPVVDGTSCNDGDLCTTKDTCQSGVCVAGPAVSCDGTTTCVVGACNPATGQCEGEPAPDGTACENECVARGRCTAGECRGSRILCESPGDCRISLGCDPLEGCQYEHKDDGVTCSDDDVCTNGDRCEDGVCVGRPLVCPEPPECKASICDPEVGCAVVDLPDDTECDDGNACSFESLCRAGECVATKSVECPVRACMSNNVCNPDTGRCAPQYETEGSACNDQNACTEGEFCTCAPETGCAVLFCDGGTEIPWTGTRCSDDICFTDVTQAAGLTWTSPAGAVHAHAAGAVFGDLDGDGWSDILIGSESEDLALYINDRAGGFIDETAGSGLSVVNTATSTWQGITSGDYDDDGDLDIYVTFNGPNFLLRNDGNGVFTDVTAASGTQDNRWSTGAVFGDLDEDGDLDLIVGNYIAKVGSFFPNHIAIDNSVFRNNGNGTFTDVAGTLNIGGAGVGDPGATLIVVFTDFDQDGDNDVLECNDFGQTVEPNRLYENDGSGRFSEVSGLLGADVELFCMGVAPGDYNRDLHFDYYHTSIGHHALLRGSTSGFTDVAPTTNTLLENDDCYTQQKQAGWGAVMEDFDNDGWQDIFVVNGYILADTAITNPLEQENKLLRNQGFGQPFKDISKSAGVAEKEEGRGLAAGDYDQDGDIDLLVINMSGPPELYRNDSVNQGRHLVVELEGRLSNRFAPNALVKAVFESYTALREYGVRPGYASSSPTEVFIGAADELIAQEIEVAWPSGVNSSVLSVPTNARVNIIEPLVTIDGLAVPGVISPNVSLTATATLTNHDSTTQTVDLDIELWDADDNVLATERQTLIMSGNLTRQVQVPVLVPATVVAGPKRWVGSVSDISGAVDQEDSLP